MMVLQKLLYLLVLNGKGARAGSKGEKTMRPFCRKVGPQITRGTSRRDLVCRVPDAISWDETEKKDEEEEHRRGISC